MIMVVVYDPRVETPQGARVAEQMLSIRPMAKVVRDRAGEFGIVLCQAIA
jgi:hypothetical protein